MVPRTFHVIYRSIKSIRPLDKCTKWGFSILILSVRELLLRTGIIRRKMMGEQAPPDVRHTAYMWSKASVGGAWANIEENQLNVQHLSGGLTNYLYLCSLPDDVKTDADIPRKVLLRIYGEIGQKTDCLVRNSVIFALFSEKKMGPKLYGMYPEGRIEEYIPARPLRTLELANPVISKEIAKKLAYIHSLEMPLCKTPNYLEEKIEEWLSDCEKVLAQRTFRHEVNPRLLKEIQNLNLREEQAFLSDIICRLNSPVVFSHNDLQEGNILMKEDEIEPERQLTVIDLEYCSYSFRGFDFGNHFCEWTLDYSVEDFPNFSYQENSFPSKENQYQFFREYLKEKRRIEGDNSVITEEELESLYKEANVFVIVSHFFWALWSIVQLEISDIEFGYLEYASNRFNVYKQKKEEALRLGLIT